MDNAHETVSLAKVPIMEMWQAIEKLVDEDLVRSIGVSNFDTQLLYDVISYAKYSIFSLQIEHDPYLVQPQVTAMPQEEGIVILATRPLALEVFWSYLLCLGKKRLIIQCYLRMVLYENYLRGMDVVRVRCYPGGQRKDRRKGNP
jgi:diketogulonate reductase-like aldo/keto reductase